MDNRAKTIRITLQDGEIVGSENVAKTGTRPSGGPGPKQYQCPHCGVVFETDEPIEGMRVDCPECGGEFVATSRAPKAGKNCSAQPSVPPKPPKKVGTAIGVGIVLLAILALAGMATRWLKRAETKSEQTSPATNTELPEKMSPIPKTAPKPSPSPSKETKTPATVNPVLGFQTVREYCKKFKGGVNPADYSFVATEFALHPTFDGWGGYYLNRWVSEHASFSLTGNPLYFYRLGTTWEHYESTSGNGNIFVRDDRFICDDDPVYSRIRVELVNAVYIYVAQNKEAARDIGIQLVKMDKEASDLIGADGNVDTDAVVGRCMNSLRQSSRFPAPVVFAYTKDAEHFLYLNDSGSPSALRWVTNNCICCFEGVSALARYAKCLRELRKTLIDYTQIAKDEKLAEYRKKIEVKTKPEIYIGDLLRGTRQQAGVEYEFLVETRNGNTFFGIQEATASPSCQLSRLMGLEDLDKELAFFSHVDTPESTEKAFAPLYCFLAQKKILYEEADRESNRLTRRFEGREDAVDVKKEQTLTFKSVGEQPKDARVELEATAESGEKVVFAVESGPGKISDKMLTFTATGKVVVCARQWGNDQWYSASATQTVTVVKAHTYKTDNSPAGRTGATRDTGASALSSGFETMIAALEAVQNEKIPENFSRMESAWRALSGSRKLKLQKNVMWAACAMYLEKGHPEKVTARKALLDTRALMREVSEECRSCYGSGHGQKKCHMCGGSGRCNFPGCDGGRIQRLASEPSPCPNCRGSGRCYVCGGRGTEEVKCRACNGSGRMVSKARCRDVVDENIEEALETCREME